MSRKKTVKGKSSSKSPKASPSSGRTVRGLTAAGPPSTGLVYPSRPSISSSGEFYDIAFKVSGHFSGASYPEKETFSQHVWLRAKYEYGKLSVPKLVK